CAQVRVLMCLLFVCLDLFGHLVAATGGYGGVSERCHWQSSGMTRAGCSRLVLTCGVHTGICDEHA
ncbi:hypothetical protein EI94DRAFT_1756415, partial [Lactarius quietus]